MRQGAIAAVLILAALFIWANLRPYRATPMLTSSGAPSQSEALVDGIISSFETPYSAKKRLTAVIEPYYLDRGVVWYRRCEACLGEGKVFTGKSVHTPDQVFSTPDIRRIHSNDVIEYGERKSVVKGYEKLLTKDCDVCDGAGGTRCTREEVESIRSAIAQYAKIDPECRESLLFERAKRENSPKPSRDPLQEQFAASRGVSTQWTNSIGISFQLIPPGKLSVSPKFEIEFSAFWLGTTEVTQKQWKSIMNTAPWKAVDGAREGDDFPAFGVTPEDAFEFVRKLNVKEGTTDYQLPTPAQWKYAAESGSPINWNHRACSVLIGHYAWIPENTFFCEEPFAHRVATRLPNRWGLFDMFGNVAEYTIGKFPFDDRKEKFDRTWEQRKTKALLDGNNEEFYREKPPYDFDENSIYRVNDGNETSQVTMDSTPSVFPSEFCSWRSSTDDTNWKGRSWVDGFVQSQAKCVVSNNEVGIRIARKLTQASNQ